MVNEERVKKKLPTMLVDGSLSRKQNFNQYYAVRYRISRLEHKNKPLFRASFRKVVKALEDFEKAMNDLNFEF